ncbi:MAG: DUF1616 domain-containing protein [Thermoplasmata archaeon]|nr:DUF1616 domain-containing protein [Thermoplasmata archaeon]
MQARLSDSRPTPLLVSYYNRTYLLATTVLVVAYTLLVLFHGPLLAQTVLGLFAFFVAPGYALCAILFGRGTTISPAAFFAVVIGLSVVLNVMFGVVFLAFGVGIPARILGAVDSTIVVFGFMVYELWRPDSVSSPAPPVPSDGPRARAHGLREILVPAGYSSGQRAVAYALVVATIVVFSYIAYISTLHPSDTTDVELGVFGPGGNSNSLPQSAGVGQVVAVNLTLGNNASLLNVDLVVQAYLNSTGPPTTFTMIPWVGTLALGPGVESEDPLQLPADATVSLTVPFELRQAGAYIVVISLELPSGTSLRTVHFPITVV